MSFISTQNSFPSPFLHNYYIFADVTNCVIPYRKLINYRIYFRTISERKTPRKRWDIPVIRFRGVLGLRIILCKSYRNTLNDS